MSAANKSPEERRRQPRVEASFPVSYKVLDETGKETATVSGRAVNISGSGVRFHTDKQIASGQVVVAEMRLPNTDDDVVAVGRVVWSRPSELAGFEVGVEFWWMGWRSEDAQRALAEYVKSKLPK